MEISSQLEDVSTVKKKLHVEVPEAEATREFGRIADEYRRHARVPGFRKGKAPLGLIRRRFASDIREEVIRKLVPDSYQQALRQSSVQPLGEPTLENLQAEEGKPLIYDAEFEVLPEIRLPAYKGLKIEIESKEITDTDVESRLEELRKQFAQLVSVEDRPAETGDLVVVDLEGEYTDDAEPSGAAIAEEGVTVQLGEEQTQQAFNDHLTGAKIGEERTFEIDYDDDYPEKRLAGRKVRFRVEVTDIKQEELPELTDDFAKDLGNFETMDDVRTAVRKDLITASERDRDIQIRSELGKQILEHCSFEVPEILVRERITEKLQEVARSFASRGVDPGQANVNWRAVRDQIRPEAEQELRSQLMLDEVARVEAIQITTEELEAEYDRIAQNTKQPVERVRQFFREEERAQGVTTALRRRRAMDIIVNNAKIQ